MSSKFETPERNFPKNRGDLVNDEETSRTNKSLATNQSLNESIDSRSSFQRKNSMVIALKEKTLNKIRSSLENAAELDKERKQFDRMVTEKDNHNYNIFHRAALDHNLNLIREIDMDDIRFL